MTPSQSESQPVQVLGEETTDDNSGTETNQPQLSPAQESFTSQSPAPNATAATSGNTTPTIAEILRRIESCHNCITSKNLAFHSIESEDIDSHSVTSRTIKNRTILSEDLARHLTIQHLAIDDELSVPKIYGVKTATIERATITDLTATSISGVTSAAIKSATINDATIDNATLTTADVATANLQTIDLGTNTITDQNLTGDWNLNAGNLTTTGTITAGYFVGSLTGPYTPTGDLDMNSHLITNLGHTGTDFTSTGGLTLADNLTVSSGGISVTGNSTITGTLTLSGNLTAPNVIYSITGTTGQVNVATASGNTTLSLPQSIATTSSPTFASLTLSNPLPVTSGGTGTATGSITGTTALAFTAGGTNQNITLTPSGSGFTILNGNVGIGTSNPLATLHISGNARITNLAGTSNRCVYVDSNGTLHAKTEDCGTSTGGDNLGDHTLTQNLVTGNYWISNDGDDEGIRIDSNGNVGIGISSPLYKLQVSGTLGIGGTAYFAQNVGIGTTSPQHTLDVNGSANVSSTLTTAYLNATNLTASYIPYAGASYLTNSNLYSNGTNVGIGTTATGTYRLNVSGDTNISGTLTTTGAISAPTSTNTINGLIINSGNLSGITNLTASQISGVDTATIDTATMDTANITTGTISTANITTLLLSGQLTSTVATGTASFTIASTTLVNNLNADLLDNKNASDFTLAYVTGNGASTSSQLAFNYAGAPFTVANSTVVTNLNADYLDGQHGSYYAPISNIAGTANYLAKFGSTNSFTNSQLFDNGTNVGIGTTSPQNKLDVNGSIAIGSYAGTYTAPSNSLIISGNVGIGTTSPATALDVAGIITATGGNSTNWNSAYTYRLTGVTNNATGLTLTLSGNNLTSSLTSGYVIPTTTEESNWNSAYTYRLISASGTSPLTLTLSSNALTGSIAQATSSTEGYLSSSDWTNFNTAYANRITSASSPLSIASNAISISQATSSTNGYLSYTDWATFNGKQTAYTNLTTIGSLSNSAGWLYNNGTGTFSYSTPTGLISGLTSGYVPYASSATGLANSGIYYNGTNVGVGTTSPNAKLQVLKDGTSGSPNFIISNDNGAQWEFRTPNSDNKLYLDVWVPGQRDNILQITNSAGSHNWGIMNGNVGIGTASPIEKLDVRGNMYLNSGVDANHIYFASHNLYLGNRPGDYAYNCVTIRPGGSDSGFLNSYLVLQSASASSSSPTYTSKVSLASDGDSYLNGGNVGIGTTSPTAQLHTIGTVRFANFGAGTVSTDANGNLSVSSDERLKTISGSFTRGLSSLLSIDPISYHWKKTSGLDTDNLYTGFSAQNVQESIPEAIGIDNRGYLTLSDRPILAATVNAIKELAGTTNQLEQSHTKLATSLATQQSTLDQQAAQIAKLTDANLSTDDKLTIIGSTLSSLNTTLTGLSSNIRDLDDQLTVLTKSECQQRNNLSPKQRNKMSPDQR